MSKQYASVTQTTNTFSSSLSSLQVVGFVVGFVGCFVLGYHQGCRNFPHHQYSLSLQKLGLYSVVAAAPGLGGYKLPRVLC